MPLREVLFGASVDTVVPATRRGGVYSGNIHSHRRDGTGDSLTGRYGGGVGRGMRGVWWVGIKSKTPAWLGGGFGKGSLTITYFHTGNPHYHRRRVVSRSCSGWEGVGPTRYGHQAKRDVLLGRPTEPIWEEAVILGCVYRTRESTRSGKADLL